MLELKKPGLYIANGKNISVLVRIAGTAPCLVAVRGILLNDMQRDGTITVLEKDSLELQDIVANPKSYVFDYPSVSEAVKNALALVEKKEPEHRIIFLQAWNEWGEGNYIEPDLKFGIEYLDVLKEEILNNN